MFWNIPLHTCYISSTTSIKGTAVNISATVTSTQGLTFLVTVTSNIDLNEDVIWAVAGQALATDQGTSYSRLSRSFEAWTLKEIRTTDGSFTTVARFEQH